MAWTTPASGQVITAANSKILYLMARSGQAGYAYWAAGTFGAVSAAGSPDTPFFSYTDELDDEGTVQMRALLIYNMTAVGACTSLTPRLYMNVAMASNSLGSIATNVELKNYGALTGGSLTAGWKTADTGWTALSALTTNISSYAITVGQLRHRFDTVTANPTITTVFALAQIRIA